MPEPWRGKKEKGGCFDKSDVACMELDTGGPQRSEIEKWRL